MPIGQFPKVPSNKLAWLLYSSELLDFKALQASRSTLAHNKHGGVQSRISSVLYVYTEWLQIDVHLKEA
jgi:hypothetical protein